MKKIVILGALLLSLLGCASAPPEAEVKLYLLPGQEAPGNDKVYLNNALGLRVRVRFSTLAELSRESFSTKYHRLDCLTVLPLAGLKKAAFEVVIENPRRVNFVLKKVVQVESPAGGANLLPASEEEIYSGSAESKAWQLEGPIIKGRSVILGAKVYVDGEEFPSLQLGDALYEAR